MQQQQLKDNWSEIMIRREARMTIKFNQRKVRYCKAAAVVVVAVPFSIPFKLQTWREDCHLERCCEDKKSLLGLVMVGEWVLGRTKVVKLALG